MPNTSAHFVSNYKNDKSNRLSALQSLRRRFVVLTVSFVLATSFGAAVCAANPQNPELHVGSILPTGARTVTIQVDGETRTVQTTAKTIGELFASEKILLGKQDRCSASLTAPITSDMDTLVITRIQIETVKEQTSIPFETKHQLSPKLRAGQTKMVQTGKDGAKVTTYRVVRKDGEVTRTKIAETIKKPQHALIHSGMRGTSFATLASRGTFAGARLLTMRATGYGPGDNGKWGAHTASGMKPGFGVVAVDPNFIRLGTRLYIEGYGYAIAGDTGGAIKGNRIDLGYNTHYEAQAVGRKSVRVMILQ